MRCFCGCGRRVTLGELGANSRAKRTRRLLARALAMNFKAGDEHQRAVIFEGESWRNQYARVLHGELTRDAIREDDAWVLWRDGARARIRQARRARR